MRLAFVLLVATNIAVLLWGLSVRTPPPASPAAPPGGTLRLIGETVGMAAGGLDLAEQAYLSGDYTMKEIAEHFAVHYATVSRAVSALKQKS